MEVGTRSLVMSLILWLCLLSVAGGTCTVVRDEKTGTRVSCCHSELTSFPTLNFSDFKVLDASFNKLYVIRHGSLSDDDLSHLRHLDVSHNLVHQLDVRALWGLHELQTLDLSHNQLSVLSNQTLVKLSLLKTLKLDHNQLSSLGPSVFRGLSNLLHLDLGHNNMRDLQKDAFSQLGRLQWLAIGFNRLERLESGAMAGLSALTFLDLSHNKLHLTSSVFPARVFRSLGQLQTLHLENNDNSENGDYPDEVFADLVSLRYLAIDTFYEASFGHDFAALSNIQTLDLAIGDNCQIGRLTNDSLHGFKNSTLSFLSFSDCPLFDMEPCVFCHLPALKRLWVTSSHWTPPNRVLESLYGLQHQAMSEIKLHSVGCRTPFLHVITKHSTRYLQNICVTSFSMNYCNIQRITQNSLGVSGTPFLQCLEHVDISDNSIIGDFSMLFHLLSSNGSLQTISIQDQAIFTITDAECLVSKNFKCKDGTREKRSEHDYTLLFPTPPNLTLLNISGLFSHFNPVPYNWTFTSALHLKSLDLSYLRMRDCYTTLYGLPNLETFNLKGNYCYNITESIFDFLTSLKKLGVSNLGISPHFFFSRGRRLFQRLDRLEKLDLSANSLKYADPEMLHNQRQLKELDLSGNRFMAMPVNVGNLGELNVLDLSSNSFTSLTSRERASLDQLAIHHVLSLKLYGNPLTCTCANLDMVRWLWTTSVTLDGEGRAGNYTCSTETGEITSTERVMRHWMGHWRKCVGVSVFGYAVAAFLIQILAVVVTFFVSRSWTQLCYAWRAVRNYHQPRRHEFRKDAFLVYADTNRDVMLACRKLRRVLEEGHGVRLLLPTRDDGAYGRVRAENIARQVDDSWKVVLLVTEDFSRDPYACGFSVQQAQRAISDVMPDRVIVIFVDSHRRLQKMPSLDVLLRVVPETNVLTVPRNTPYNHPVWERLAHLITGQP